MEKENLGNVKLSFLEKMIRELKKQNKAKNDLDISAEFLIPSCFPQLWKNYNDNIHAHYTQGFIDGRKSMEEENATNFDS